LGQQPTPCRFKRTARMSQKAKSSVPSGQTRK
jgi:hypothetical protein